MFPVNPFPGKHPVVAELEEAFQVKAREIFPGCTMLTLPPHPDRHLTVAEVVSLNPRPEESTSQDEPTEHEDEDDDSSGEICPACNDSGEGAYDGTSCGTCHPRRGSRNNQDQFEEPEAPDYPDNYEG